MKYPNHFMIDIESTGTLRGKDKILQIGMIEMEYIYPYWHPIPKRVFNETLFYAGQPENDFAKKHMVDLYKACNAVNPLINQDIGDMVRNFIHTKFKTENITIEGSHGREYSSIQTIAYLDKSPKLFMGWNASGFDIPFMFEADFLTPSFYVSGKDGKDELRGDVHYRIYEQTGSLQFICNATGLDSKTIQQLAMDLNPTGIVLPEGKSHDALYDCYKQIIMQNGMIAIARMGIKK